MTITTEDLERMLSEATKGPWYPGHLCDDTHSCNCASILSETGIFGAVASVHVNNGLSISDGGNDAPSEEEAKANQRLIAAAPDLARELLAARKAVEALKECDHAITAMGVGIQVHNERADRRGEARIEGAVPANLLIAGVKAGTAIAAHDQACKSEGE